MIVELGAFALILALVLAGLTTVLTTAGRLRASPVLAGAGGGALIASALTSWIVSVRRRWLAEELVWLQQNAAVSAPALAPGALAQAAQTGVHA